MPVTMPPNQTTRMKTSVMRAIEANEEESLRSGSMSAEEAEADLDELFKDLEVDLAAGRIKP